MPNSASTSKFGQQQQHSNKNNIYFEDAFDYLILYERGDIGDSKTIKFTQIEEVFTELKVIEIKNPIQDPFPP